MSQELQAGPVTLLQIFKGEREYVSPLFQRRYVWGKKEIDQLWEDIDDILDGEESTHFLGALVLEVKSAGLAFKPDSTWIVDGQQRLTTLYMTLLRVGIEAEKEGASDLAASLYRQYVFNQDGDHRNRPKLLPTLLDYTQFNGLFSGIKSISPRLQASFGESMGDIQKADGLIRRAVRDRCTTEGVFDEERAKRLVAILLEKLRFVQIILGDQIDPHQVFDSLNTRGVKLENKDLIRNIVFQGLNDDPVAAESLYRQKWLALEDELKDRFDDYFFPFALIHKPSVTKSSLLSSLRDRWNEWPPEQIIADLRTYVPAFNALTSAFGASREAITTSAKINECIARLHRMPAPTSTYPFLLRIIEAFRQGTIAEEQANKTLLLVESFLVRRAFAGFEPTGLHAVFKDLWSKTDGNPDRLVTVIDANPTVHFPDDAQFADDIRRRPLYGRRLSWYILAEYERSLTGGDPYVDTKFTIDHIIPQELNSSWELVVSQNEHKSLKDTWANLVPLSIEANAEKARKPWPLVRDYFMTETRFKTTKRLAHEHESWGVPEIARRADSLVAWSLVRWPKT